MILIKENVERVAATPAAIASLKKQGYKELSLNAGNQEKAESDTAAPEPVAKEEIPDDDIASMKKADLVRIASERGIKGASSLTKEELLEALR